MANRLNLKIEEVENLVDIATHPGYKVLEEICTKITNSRTQRVVNYNLENGSDRELALHKARLEGALQAFKELKDTVNKVKKAHLHK